MLVKKSQKTTHILCVRFNLMAVIIQKFGGTSLSDAQAVERCAQRAISALKTGNQVIVVTSAMGDTTDRLCNLALDTSYVKTAERDTLLASGEQISASLMALCLQKKGVKSRSFLAWQLPIVTSGVYGDAEITHIDTDPLCQLMREGGIAVVAGFQGVTKSGRLSTLGRGGSDITALALAAFLKKNLKVSDISCYIYTDVSGVFVADPGLVPYAKKLDVIDCQSMHHMAKRGACVLHPRAVSYAAKHGISLCVRSSFEALSKAEYVLADTMQQGEGQPGTWIRSRPANEETSLSKMPFVLAATKGWSVLPTLSRGASLERFMAQTLSKHRDSCFEMACLTSKAPSALVLRGDIYKAYRATFEAFLETAPKEGIALLSLYARVPSAFQDAFGDNAEHTFQNVLGSLWTKLCVEDSSNAQDQGASLQVQTSNLLFFKDGSEYIFALPEYTLCAFARALYDVLYTPEVSAGGHPSHVRH